MAVVAWEDRATGPLLSETVKAVCEDGATGSMSLPLVSLKAEPAEGADLTPRITSYQGCRNAVKCIVDQPTSSSVAYVVQWFIIGLICLSTVSVIIETVPGMEKNRKYFSVWEKVVTMLFTIEISVRLWVADSVHLYLTTCSNIVDIVATLPGYIELFLASQRIDPFWRTRTRNVDAVWSMQTLRVLQMVRLMRILRLAKAARHSEIVTTVMSSFYASLNGLSALVVFVGSSAVLSATVVFWTENADQETQFTSIPAAIWWSLATITGVGYGDMVPLTTAGKCAGAITMIMGVLAISMSVAIITTAFMEEYRKSLALLKLDRIKKRKSFRLTRDMERERRGSMEDYPLGEWSPLSASENPTRSSSMEQPVMRERSEGDVLSTLMELEASSKEVLMQLEAIMLEAERSAAESHVVRKRTSFSAAPSTPGGSTAMAGPKVALAFLREQNAVWFRHASQLAEQVLESQARADTIDEELP